MRSTGDVEGREVAQPGEEDLHRSELPQEADVVGDEVAEVVDAVACVMARRSMPKPKAKPCHSSGSMPQLASTLGCTIPQPPSSRNEPSGRMMSNSADGSVNGKYDGRSRDAKSPPKNAFVNASIVPARWAKVMPRSIDEPLDLVEHRQVRGVGGVLAEHPARHDRVVGRRAATS